MAFIRKFEEQVQDLGREGHVVGSVHLCLGQEAIPVGAMSVLEPGDKVLATYRGHGWALACGADPLALMAEIAQRADGVNGGRAGSPMLSAPDAGFLGENSIIGAGLPIAAGVAMADGAKGGTAVVLASLGDGAMNQGGTTEAMIFAAAKNLPVIFACENNGWAEMTPTAVTTRGEHLAMRGQGLNIESHVVDGNDPVAVADAVADAARVCRSGTGPVLLEFKTARLSGHYNKDIQHYRQAEDIEAAKRLDPLLRLRELEGLSDEDAALIDAEVDAEIKLLAEKVRQMPAPNPDGVFEHLYAPDLPVPASSQTSEVKEIPYFRAVNEALKNAMQRRDEVIVYGEDVGYAGGIFGVTRGLQKQFGQERVFDTPIAESAILGSAVGAAIAGLRPVVEIMWADFVFVALDQIINQASNVRYVNRSKLSAPLVIRMQQGVTPGSCAQHSQSIEAILSHIPGIKVGLPATPQDAYAMTLAAIEDPDPVVLLEHRSMYQTVGEVALNGPTEIAAGAVERRDGADVAIISWGSMVAPALEAAERLSDEGIDATVVDLRWLRPLDDQAIAKAVSRCGGRVVIAHEAFLSGGFGAEVSALITERHFDLLVSPVVRVGTPDVRMPSAPSLQDSVLPTASDIIDAARRVHTR
ncbi:thiamine pyrophosphate-dependent enzyme [Pseudarthrobacter sp. R1]|uniref:alpha-ketoacid dehydrogenase subunit alpha/beta n=1 Tax=Pseudarthrobacter sp. R1 TaxID=2944934 RepID=UPI00210CABE3|nr:alpha-ketoacid dehydrogenase subunit alpha/beta [Pseudarthrobacter sp. R1]MCQ6272309.1 thiamine pyrophosphate-dependent enzyme [Pseudarthrobacter sp. R1]